MWRALKFRKIACLQALAKLFNGKNKVFLGVFPAAIGPSKLGEQKDVARSDYD